MAHADFVHLHVHSAYSLSEGAIRLAELVKLCAAERMPAVAVTDTGNLFGALEFSEAAAKAGVQPIIGCQLFVARPDQPQGGIVTVPNGGAQPVGREAPPDELVLLVQDETGYLNLSALSSMAFTETPAGIAPRVTLDDVARHSAGLIALTGGPRRADRPAARRRPAPGRERDARTSRGGVPRTALCRADAPRARDREPHRGRPDRSRLPARPAARRDQRRLFRRRGDVRGA